MKEKETIEHTLQTKPKLKKIIVVDPENGLYKTIEEAIKVADWGTVIRVCEGVYTCSLMINKPGLKIEPRDKDKQVYLLSN